LVFGNLRVRVIREILRQDDFVGKGTTDRKRIAHNRPLRLAEQTQDLAEIVDQTRQDEPARVPIAANRLRYLEQVLDLAQIDVGVAVVHERIEKLHRLPDAHAALAERQVLPLFRLYEIKRLVAVVEPIKLPDARPDVALMVTEVLLLLRAGSKRWRHI